MAKLLSEDEQVKTSFELILLRDQIEKRPSISWISYKLLLKSGDKTLAYEKDTNNKGAGDFVFALVPVNELESITSGIKDFLKDRNKSMFSFEPLEPSFELIMERSQGGYSVSCWVDAGNVIFSHFTWDGFGLRFFTTEENILSFVDELNNEKSEITNNA